MFGDNGDSEPCELLYKIPIIDTHIHLSHSYSGGLPNEWQQGASDEFKRDFTESDLLTAVNGANLNLVGAVFVECFNRPAVEEARWVLEMVKNPQSIVVALVAQVAAQDGPAVVHQFIEEMKDSANGELPAALKGVRMVFPATSNNSPTACLEEPFIEGLRVLMSAGLHWEFCVNPSMAPNLPSCCRQLPEMTFVINHLAHNGNEGGEMAFWGPAIDELGKLKNCYMKMGAVEEWDVPNPEEYMDRALCAFGFERVLYESNWFVSEAMGDRYDKTARLLWAACERAGASTEQKQQVFAGNARKVYRLPLHNVRKVYR